MCLRKYRFIVRCVPIAVQENERYHRYMEAFQERQAAALELLVIASQRQSAGIEALGAIVPAVAFFIPENELLQKAVQKSRAAYEKAEKKYKVHSLSELISRVNERRDRKFWCTTACETCLIFAHTKPALQPPELLMSVVVSEDLSVRMYFKCAPFVSDDVCIPAQIRDVRVLDNLLDKANLPRLPLG